MLAVLWNCGTEGPAEDPNFIRSREYQKRNFLATLFLSQGVPMICAGDEIGRIQRGDQIGPFGLQQSGSPAGQVRLPAGVMGEGVEDAKTMFHQILAVVQRRAVTKNKEQ